MPVVPMREILDRAFAERYGVAAINVVDDLTLEAVLAAATELEAPLIVQTSLKTVKSIGAEPLVRDVARAGRRGAGPGDAAPRPLPRPRVDHDAAWRRAGTRCCSTAPSSTSRRTRARRSRWSPRPSATARRSRARSRASPASRTGSAPSTAARSTRSRCRPSSSPRPAIYSFAPAIGTAHGLYKTEPHLMPERVTEIVAQHPIPMVLHGGTGPDRGAVPRPDRARVRQGQHLDGAEDRVRRRAPRVPRREPRQARPAVAAAPRARGGEGHGGAPHPHVRVGRAGAARSTPRPPEPRARADLRLRRRPRRHRARRPPAGVQPGVRRGRAAASTWSEEEYGRAAADRRRQGADRVAVPDDRRARERERDRRAAQAQDRDLQGDRARRAGCPAGPGVARIVDEALAAGWTLAVASTSAEESVRAVLEHVVGAETAARFAVFAGDVVPGEEARPGDLPARARRARRRAAPTRSWSRTRATACSPRVGAGLRCVVTRQQLHGATRTCARRSLVVTSLGDPGEPARVLANRSAARPGDRGDGRRPRGVPDRTPARGGGGMSETALRQAELVVRAIAQTAVDNETLLLRARRGRRRRRLRLLARARLRERALRLGRAGVRRRRRAAQEDRDRPDQADRRHVGPDLGHRVPARRRLARRQAGADAATRSSRRCAPRSRGSSSAATPTSATRRCSTRSSRPSTRSRRRSARARRPRWSARRPPRARAPRRRRGCSRSAGGRRTRASAAATRPTPARSASRCMFEAVSKAWRESELERA